MRRSSLTSTSEAPLMAGRCSVVVITCHDLGRHLGCHGVPSVRSPNLDRLAASGVLFEQAFCTAPQCSPARGTLATGRYPHAIGLLGLAHAPFDWDIDAEVVPIARHLQAQGWQTHLFGLQHITIDVRRLGFDAIHPHERPAALSAGVATQFEALFADLPDAPVYVEVNLEEPHRPYDQGGCLPDSANGVHIPPYVAATPAAAEEFAALQGAIHQADSAIGRILAAIERSAHAERTLIVFAADHGIAMPRAKCTLYDPGIAVTLMLRGPMLPAGRRVAGMVSTIDVVPTICDLAGIAAPDRVDGHSLRAAIDGGRGRTSIFAEKTYHSYFDPMRCIRTDRWKLIRNFEASFAVEVPGDVQQGAIFREDPSRYSGAAHPPVELYDLLADAHETRNLAASPDHGDILAGLGREIDAWMRDTGDPLLSAGILSPRRRALRSTGGIG
jgi:N-sulfoglucosamine sulfohydrolase